jgi:glycosyltransferase involved in cell wall biosynthesis
MPSPNLAESLEVTVLTTSYPLVPGSASGIFVARLFEAMPSDIRITVLTPDAVEPVAAPTETANLRVRPVRYAPRQLQRLAHQPGGVPVALRENPLLYAIVPMLLLALATNTLRAARRSDVLHANWAINACIAGLVGRLTGRPLLTSLRGEDVTRARSRRGARLMLALALYLSRRVVAVSHDMADWLRLRFPWADGRISVIENGIAPAFLAAGAARQHRPAPAAARIVAVGSLIPRKGQDVLIKALAHCADLPWHLELIGDGPTRPELERLAGQLGLAGRITILGAIPPDEIASRLANADAFVLPSHAEGRPNALLEAMAAGLPVVASAIDGVTELVQTEHNGLLAPAGDAPAFGQALRRLLMEPELAARLGTAAHRHIIGLDLSWQGSARRYARLYRDMLESPPCVE